MKITVSAPPTFQERISKVGKTYKLWDLTDQNGEVFAGIFGGPFVVGQEVELAKNEKGGWDVVAKSPAPGGVSSSFKPASGFKPAETVKKFEADPKKLKQELDIETARNMSIQRQVAVKGTIDLIVSGKLDYDQLHAGYVHIMELLSEHDWQRFVSQGDDQPPIETYEDEIDLSEVLS